MYKGVWCPKVDVEPRVLILGESHHDGGMNQGAVSSYTTSQVIDIFLDFNIYSAVKSTVFRRYHF